MLNTSELSDSEMAILDNLPWGVFLLSPTIPSDESTFIVLAMNNLAEKITSISPEELIGRKLDRLVPGLRNFGILKRCAEVLATGVPSSPLEIRYGDARMGPTWLGVRIFPVRDSYVALCLEDINARKKSEETLAEENKKLSDILCSKKILEERISSIAKEWTTTFDAIPDYVCIIEPDFRVRRMNKAMASLLGASPADLVGRTCYRLMHGTEKPIEACPMYQSISSGEPVSTEIDDPNIGIPLRVTCSPFRDESGKVAGIVHVATDITEERKIAGEKENLIEELKQSLANVRQLRGFLPICASCKKIRNDKGYWEQIETYIRDHSEAEFSHGVCPECAKALYSELEEFKDP